MSDPIAVTGQRSTRFASGSRLIERFDRHTECIRLADGLLLPMTINGLDCWLVNFFCLKDALRLLWHCKAFLIEFLIECSFGKPSNLNWNWIETKTKLPLFSAETFVRFPNFSDRLVYFVFFGIVWMSLIIDSFLSLSLPTITVPARNAAEVLAKSCEVFSFWSCSNWSPCVFAVSYRRTPKIDNQSTTKQFAGRGDHLIK